MCAGHDIACLRIGSRYVRENIVGVVIAVLEVNAAVDLEFHFAALARRASLR
jgi:hypothetical protein